MIFFQDLFNTRNMFASEHLLSKVSKCISDEENEKLKAKFTKEEIRVALKGMGPIKASSDDGFAALFFQQYWHIVGSQVTHFYLQILNDHNDVATLNVMNIILIPKIPHPFSMANFRPISLCNMLYKMIVTAIGNRFQRVLENCINIAQSAFVLGKLIFDNSCGIRNNAHSGKNGWEGKAIWFSS